MRNLRAGHFAGVDQALDAEVGVGLEAAGGAGGGHAGGEVESGEAEGLLGVDRGGGGVEEVLVHADEAGDDGVAGEVEDVGVGGRPGRRRSCRWR